MCPAAPELIALASEANPVLGPAALVRSSDTLKAQSSSGRLT